MQEALLHHAIDHADQRCIEAIHIEERAWLVADAQLAPGQHLEDFFHCPEAAGQGHEAIGQVEHARLALVHRADDLQFGQAAMGHFPVGQLARDHAGHFTAGGKYGVGHGSHQADVAAAVHQAQAAGLLPALEPQ
ncbi:hypothetical protein G6F23_014608 [Rhizopus arrhizus]|nr:hypothetical protein G6F23_014608 [Rhizopus arrhizus]